MSTIFFMPWVVVDPMIDFGEFRLFAYERGVAPGTEIGIPQDAVDAVLGNYGDRRLQSAGGHPRPVQRATIVHWPSDDPSASLTDEQVIDRMTIGTWLTFACLSSRRFARHSHYWNADDVALVGQRFDDSRPGAVLAMTRRRDGRSLNYMQKQGDAPLFQKPHHCQADRVELDVRLMKALLDLGDEALSSRLTEAIRLFIRANSDAPSVEPASELTLIRIAFDELLNVGHKAEQLRFTFAAHFAGELPVPPTWFAGDLSEAVWAARWYVKTRPADARPADAWVADFCAARNQASHGRDPAQHHPSPVWSVHNHLLFASWLFPLMVKKVLSDVGLYDLTDSEREARSGFERFFAHDILGETETGSGKLWWSEVEGDLFQAELDRAIRSLSPGEGAND